MCAHAVPDLPLKAHFLCGSEPLKPSTSVRPLNLCWAPRLYILADQLTGSGAALAPVACNDDFCGYLSQLTVRPMRVLLPTWQPVTICWSVGVRTVFSRIGSQEALVMALARGCFKGLSLWRRWQ